VTLSRVPDVWTFGACRNQAQIKCRSNFTERPCHNQENSGALSLVHKPFETYFFFGIAPENAVPHLSCDAHVPWLKKQQRRRVARISFLALFAREGNAKVRIFRRRGHAEVSTRSRLTLYIAWTISPSPGDELAVVSQRKSPTLQHFNIAIFKATPTRLAPEFSTDGCSPFCERGYHLLLFRPQIN